jgi:hypothetical protein
LTFPCLYLIFHKDLQMLLRKIRAAKVLKYALARRASLKDIIESQGIPHTKIAQILLNKKELGFFSQILHYTYRNKLLFD